MGWLTFFVVFCHFPGLVAGTQPQGYYQGAVTMYTPQAGAQQPQVCTSTTHCWAEGKGSFSGDREPNWFCSRWGTRWGFFLSVLDELHSLS